MKVINTGTYNPVVRHIDIRNLWLIDKVVNGAIIAYWIQGDINVADLGMKPLARTRLYILMHLMGMRRVLYDGLPTPPNLLLEGKAQSHISLADLSGAELVMLVVDRWNELLR